MALALPTKDQLIQEGLGNAWSWSRFKHTLNPYSTESKDYYLLKGIVKKLNDINIDALENAHAGDAARLEQHLRITALKVGKESHGTEKDIVKQLDRVKQIKLDVKPLFQALKTNLTVKIPELGPRSPAVPLFDPNTGAPRLAPAVVGAMIQNPDRIVAEAITLAARTAANAPGRIPNPERTHANAVVATATVAVTLPGADAASVGVAVVGAIAARGWANAAQVAFAAAVAVEAARGAGGATPASVLAVAQAQANLIDPEINGPATAADVHAQVVAQALAQGNTPAAQAIVAQSQVAAGLGGATAVSVRQAVEHALLNYPQQIAAPPGAIVPEVGAGFARIATMSHTQVNKALASLKEYESELADLDDDVVELFGTTRAGLNGDVIIVREALTARSKALETARDDVGANILDFINEARKSIADRRRGGDLDIRLGVIRGQLQVVDGDLYEGGKEYPKTRLLKNLEELKKDGLCLDLPTEQFWARHVREPELAGKDFAAGAGGIVATSLVGYVGSQLPLVGGLAGYIGTAPIVLTAGVAAFLACQYFRGGLVRRLMGR